MDENSADVCPDCSNDLSAEPVAADHHLAMRLRCPVHGEVAVLEPF
jgi:uncharacterized radical SAM superfamily Fe-S cluster-containing enzyme